MRTVGMRTGGCKAGLALVLCLMATGAVSAAEKGLVTGWGAARLSKTLVSLWISGHAGTRVGPLVVVYYHGLPNWHRRSWHNQFEQNQSPGGVVMAADGIELQLEANIDDETVTVQEQSYARRENNVFLVIGADGNGADQRVVPLGFHDLRVDGEGPLPQRLLHVDRALAERLERETAAHGSSEPE